MQIHLCGRPQKKRHLTGNWRNVFCAIYVCFVVAFELPLVDIKIGFGDCANIDVLALFAFPSQWTCHAIMKLHFHTLCCLIYISIWIISFLSFSSQPTSVGISKGIIPKTQFSCRGRSNGYYADTETGCQVYHMCDEQGRQFSYACPNTTLFQQRMLICDHWYMVDCSSSEANYAFNRLIGQRVIKDNWWLAMVIFQFA